MKKLVVPVLSLALGWSGLSRGEDFSTEVTVVEEQCAQTLGQSCSLLEMEQYLGKLADEAMHRFRVADADHFALLRAYMTERRLGHAADELVSKYQQLAELIARPDEGSPGMRELRHHELIYHPLSVIEVEKVYARFGKLSIDPRSLGVTEKVEARRPWSGYWYPFAGHKILYEGPSSVLAKFDRLAKMRGMVIGAQEFERKMMAGFSPDTWEGLCDGWALAAVSSVEPQRDLTISGIRFSPAEQKALLTYSHLKRTHTRYGVSYRGDGRTDGSYQDLRPEAFHRLVTQFLRPDNQGVVVDDTPSAEVWNKPLYRYRFTIQKDPEIPHAYQVQAYPWFIKQRDSESDRPTDNEDRSAPLYQYRLYTSAEPDAAGNYPVIAGVWLGDSVDAHPDTVLVPESKGSLGSYNQEFNKAISLIQEHFLLSK